MTDVADRFWAKVDRSADPNGCWLWTASSSPQGYGRLRISGRLWLAHRVSYLLAYGLFDSVLQVLHRCDTPACVNPAHLFLGMNADNVADRERKGRGVYVTGERHGQARLTEAQVQEIRRLARQGVPTTEIAPLFKVVRGTVNHIIARRTWQHVA